MKALTLHRPWPWAIFHVADAPKRVENRGWQPPDALLGERIALHAGKVFEEDAAEDLADRGCPTDPAAHPLGIIGVANIRGWVRSDRVGGGGVGRLQHSRTLLIEEAAEAVRSSWWVGPIGWVLFDVRPLPEPVPCRGAQGLWTLDREVEARVLAQFASAA